MNEDEPHRTRGRVAAALGWLALFLVAMALVPWVRSLLGLTQGVGRDFAIGAWLSLVALVVATIALIANWRAMHPRSWTPVIALLMALSLAALNVWGAIMVAGLANMH